MRCDFARLASTFHARALVPSVPFLLWLHFSLCYDSSVKDTVNVFRRIADFPTAKSARKGRGRRRDLCGARVSATHIYVHIYIIYCISNGRTTTSHYMRHWNLYIMNELKEENLLNNYLDIINPRTLRRSSRAGRSDRRGRSYSHYKFAINTKFQ